MWEHVAPQLIPAGLEPIAPDPLPAVATVRVCVGAWTVTWIELLPVRPPFREESLSVTVRVKGDRDVEACVYALDLE